MTINSQVPQHEPVKNFFKNFWQPWNAPKGERTAPIIGFIAATVLFLPLFLPAVGIAALVKWVKPIKESSLEVQNTANNVNSLANPIQQPVDDKVRLEEVTGRVNEWKEAIEKLDPEKRAHVVELLESNPIEVFDDMVLNLNNFMVVDPLQFENQYRACHRYMCLLKDAINNPEALKNRNKALQTVIEQYEELQNVIKGLEPSKQAFLTNIIEKLLEGFQGIIEDLKNSKWNETQFNVYLKESNGQMKRINNCIKHLDEMMEAEGKKEPVVESKNLLKIQDFEQKIKEAQKGLEEAQKGKTKLESDLKAFEEAHSTQLDKDEKMGDKLVARRRGNLRVEIKRLEDNINDLQTQIKYYQEEIDKLQN